LVLGDARAARLAQSTPSLRRIDAVEAPNREADGDVPPQCQTPQGDANSESGGDAWSATCEALIARLRVFTAPPELAQTPGADTLTKLSAEVVELVDGVKAGGFYPCAAGLLREVLGLLDLKDPACTFKLSKCALTLLKWDCAVEDLDAPAVQAAYLSIAKILFKLSKAEAHDMDFMTDGLLAPLVEVLAFQSSGCSSNELKIYVVGVLKNVSNDDANQRLLVERNAVGSLFGLIGRGDAISSTEAPLLIQVMATLRSLASHGLSHFLVGDRLSVLTRLMEVFPSNVELLTNVSRTLAKLALHGPVLDALGNPTTEGLHVRRIAKVMRDHPDATPLVLRLSFVLGSLTANGDGPRQVLASECEGLTMVPQLLARYWQKERKLAGIDRDRGQKSGARSEIEEVLVKLVRLIANMAINVSVGPLLASDSAVVDPLVDMLGAMRISESEELVLNVVSAVTNLLFYDVPSNVLFHEDNKQLLCRLLRPLLLESYNVEALIEAARALGNLSRHKDGRVCMSSIRLDEIMAILLNHDDRDLVFYVCGTLVNLAADPDCKARLLRVCPVVMKLGELLNDASDDDELLLVAVKVLVNLSLDHLDAWPVAATVAVSSALARLVADADLDDGGENSFWRRPTCNDEGCGDGNMLVELSRSVLDRLSSVVPEGNDYLTQ